MTQEAEAWHEIHVREYGTFDQGSFELFTKVKDKALAEAIKDSMRGWGREVRIDSGKEKVIKPWQLLPKAHFDKFYVISDGEVYLRDSEAGREILGFQAQRAEAERRAMVEDVERLEKVTGTANARNRKL